METRKIRKFHELSATTITSMRAEDLERVRLDFELPIPPHNRRVLKTDHVRQLRIFIGTPEYQTHLFEYYTHARSNSFDDIPEMYRTRTLILRHEAVEYMEPEDFTFERALRSVKRPSLVKYIPLEAFTHEQRAIIIRESSSAEILRNASTAEIAACLTRWPLALEYVAHDEQTFDMCEQCTNNTGLALPFCAPSLVTDEIEEWAIRKTPEAIQWARRNDAKRYDALCLLALVKDPWTIEYMPQTPERRAFALGIDWTCQCALEEPVTTYEKAFIEECKQAQEEKKKHGDPNPKNLIAIDE